MADPRAHAQHRFCELLRDVEYELAAHWNDLPRAQRITDALSEAAADMVKAETEVRFYDTDF